MLNVQMNFPKMINIFSVLFAIVRKCFGISANFRFDEKYINTIGAESANISISIVCLIF